MELLEQTEKYRIETEPEAVNFIQDSVADHSGTVDYKKKYRNKKQKGEVIEDWYEVTVTKKFEV